MSPQDRINNGEHMATKLIQATEVTEDLALFMHTMKNLPDNDECFVYGFLSRLAEVAIAGLKTEQTPS
jgi:hypothetical protein